MASSKKAVSKKGKSKAKSQVLEPTKAGKWTAEIEGDTLTLTVKLGKGYKTLKGNLVRATTSGNKEFDEIAPGLFIGCSIYEKT